MAAAHSTVTYRDLEGLGFPGYRVGDDGSVWTCKNARWGRRDKWKELSPAPMSSGYLLVSLGRGSRNKRTVHSLAASAFHGPCPSGMQCRHLDGNKVNNRADNLIWGTPQENAQDKRRHGTLRNGISLGLANGGRCMAKLPDEIVRWIVEAVCLGIQQRRLARWVGIREMIISNIRHGRTYRHVASENDLERMNRRRSIS